MGLATQHKKAKRFTNEYDGFYPDATTLKVVPLVDYGSDTFYNDFVKTRTPVVIEGVIPGIDLDLFQPDTIVDHLKSDDLLLVEKKDRGGYGSGTERLKMSFKTFMDTLKAGGDGFYLTTQYTEDDPEEVNRALAKKLELEEENEESDEDEDEDDDGEPSPSVAEDSASEDDDEEGDARGDIPPESFSDADSIDFNNLHDDFDEMSHHSGKSDDDEDEGDELVTHDVIGYPLYKAEADTRVHEFIQKPLTRLVNEFPLVPSILDKLATQQINLWVGKSTPSSEEFVPDPERPDYGLGRRLFGGGVSSGLHHDHADNLYIPACGAKRFTIFSPLDAQKMDTAGNIRHVYPSGVIDYKNDDKAPGWRSLRDDSAILTEVAKWRLDNEEDLTEEQRDELITLIEHEDEELQDYEAKVLDNEGIKKDPPSFSKIPCALLHLDKVESTSLREELSKFSESRWPELSKAKKVTVDLKHGQMLYLPAGWFHEVTSFGSKDGKNDFHIALNYWFSPPSSKENVYSDDYWRTDFSRTLAACKYHK